MNTSVCTPDSLLTQLQWRYATKKFDATQKINLDQWQALEQSLVLSPSSFGLQPWKFFVITSPEKRAQLLSHSWNQQQVVDASHFVVLAIKKDLDEADVERYLARMAEVQQIPRENLDKLGGVVNSFLDKLDSPLAKQAWSARQVYIALGFFMLSAALLGIDTCPMEGIDPSAYDQVLELEDLGYQTVVACAAGYRAADDGSAQRLKVRYAQADVITYL
ncbi:NAD(P)H-dependent oxidoreductase [Synechocystis sp. LKSZ1]|uniref:NAD(P)H-dependent oxidoreductase n=1 Tax=Synechocystis sp. LKSZ1 TaxID=3144951 RepID=UPI00336C28A7